MPDGQNRYCQFLFYHYHIAENATGCRTRQACLCVCDNFRLACHFHTGLMSDKPVFRQCTAGGTSATASHARMTITVTELPSRRQESTAFPPLLLRRPLSLPVARCAIPSAPFSFSPLHVCLHFHAAFRTASARHFRCRGKGNSGIIRGCKVKPLRGCPEKSPPSQAQVVFYPTNLASPNPYL